MIIFLFIKLYSYKILYIQSFNLYLIYSNSSNNIMGLLDSLKQGIYA